MRDYSPLRALAAGAPSVHLKSSTVIELLDELERLRGGIAARAQLKRNDYPADFEAVWETYPDRPGDSKKAAHKAWAVRVKAGVTVAQMLAGAQAYAVYVKAMRVEPQFIKQAATFFGPGEWYAADWSVPAQQPKPAAGGAWWKSEESMRAKAMEVGAGLARPGEKADAWEARIKAAIENGGTPPAPPVRIRPTDAAANAPEQRGMMPAGLNLKALIRPAPPPRAA